MERIYDVIVVGGGPGGYTAALYAARAGLSVVILERMAPGGQMALTDQIDNYPGFPEGIDGFTLGQQMRAGAERFGVETVLGQVQSVRLRSDPKEVRTEERGYLGRTVVIATGAEPRELGVPGERALVGRGVSYCATCDGMFYRGKTVVVVGGGNTAAADVLALSRIAQKVILIHRREDLRASKVYHAQLQRLSNVELRWNSRIVGLRSGELLTGVEVEDLLTGERQQIECDGLFVAIGRRPATELFAGQVALDEGGYVVAGESTCTDVPGVFAVGDVRTKEVRQIVTAAGDGAVAAYQAERFLDEG